MTDLKTALKTAGLMSPQQRLLETAMTAVRDNPRNWDGARGALYSAIQDDAALLWAMLEPYRIVATQRLLTEAAGHVRQEERVKDMRQSAARTAPMRPQEVGGHRVGDNQLPSAPLRTDQHAGGQRRFDSQAPNAPSRAGQDAVAAVVRRSLLDTIKINGMPIGDCTVGDVRLWATKRQNDAREASRDVRFALELAANLPSNEIIRDWWKNPAEIDELYRRAEEENAA